MYRDHGHGPSGENLEGAPSTLAATTSPVDAESNHLLQAFSLEAFSNLARFLVPIEMACGDVLWEPDVPISAVYFPGTAVCAVLAPLANARPFESVTVGHEGMLGTAVLLGAGSSHTFARTHVAGSAVRIPADDFLEWLETAEARAGAVGLLGRYVQTLLDQTVQAVACSGLHTVKARCARWLLATRDRVGANEFGLQHVSLAAMLGVRRASITEAAGLLREQGLIRYTRGRVTIVDGAALEDESCECYDVMRLQHERLLASSLRARGQHSY
jgi:CRP-like cAMP-binding protein